MPFERDQRWLKDIRDNIQIIEDVVARAGREGFGRDVALRYAVTYALLSISEAARRLSTDFKTHYSSIDWRDVEDAGNAYRHEYHRLDIDVLWETATTELASLKRAIADA